MCEELRLERFDDTPWGFRLTGGLDFGTPLTVIKVTGGSIAELGGVQVGDIVVEINGSPTKHVTHTEAQNYIGSSKGHLTLSVLRGSLVTPPDVTPLRGMTPMIDTARATPTLNNNLLKEKLNQITDDDEQWNGPVTIHQKTGSVAELTKRDDPGPVDVNMTEVELAELLTGNEEVLEQGVLGINFQKFLPQVDFIRQSEVFKFLQNENTHKEVPEDVQLKKEPTKRFSTFLMKPKPPPPKPLGDPWIHPKAPNYLPRDHKKNLEEPKRRIAPPKEEPGHSVLWLFLEETGDNVVDQRWGNDEEERINMSRNSCIEYDKSSRTSSVLSRMDDVIVEEGDGSKKESVTPKIEIEVETSEEKDSDKPPQSTKPDNTISTKTTQLETVSRQIKTREEEEVKFAKRLEDIQRQITVLEEHAPADLQTQLDAIHEQLDKIVKLKIQETQKYQEIREEIITEEREETVIREYFSGSEDELSNFDEEETHETNFVEEDGEDVQEKEDIGIEGKEVEEGVVEYQKGQYEVCEAPPPPQKRPAHPLTPQARPIVLPGGRMWRQPKDAAHDEFYTGVLVAQAEVLVGSDVGVNFTKYVPPKFDMSHSAVYRLIHELEDKTRKMSNAENEYYNSPISKRHFYAATLREPSPIGNVELSEL